MLVLLDFEAFLNAEIAGVSIYSFVIFSNQICSFGNIVLVCRGNRNGINQPTSGVYANMSLHAKAPHVAFSGLVHLRIACFLRIFRRTGRVNDRGVHNRTAFHHVTALYHNSVYCFKKQLV